jgi:hypothetical protein
MIKDDERKIATLKTRKSEENSEKLAFFGIADQDRDACRCDGGTSRGIPTEDRPAHGERGDTATDRHFGGRIRTLAMTAMQLAELAIFERGAAGNRSFNAATGATVPCVHFMQITTAVNDRPGLGGRSDPRSGPVRQPNPPGDLPFPAENCNICHINDLW